MASKQYKLDKKDGKKIIKGAGIAMASALVVYASEIIPAIDWGQYTALVVAMSGVLINVCRKYLSGK